MPRTFPHEVHLQDGEGVRIRVSSAGQRPEQFVRLARSVAQDGVTVITLDPDDGVYHLEGVEPGLYNVVPKEAEC